MALDEKKKELLKKVYALAERGERGEKEAARYMLEKLLEKYDIDEVELADEERQIHWFTCKDDQERTLFYQVCYKVGKDLRGYRKTRGQGKNSQKGVECTKAEALQIEIEYEFYKALWREERDFMLRAFIQKHHIFYDGPDAPVGQDMDPEEYRRMTMLMAGLQNRPLHKMIEG